MDRFAVKGSPPITLELGQWNLKKGITLQLSKNRWDRRRDLKGAVLVNAVIENGDFISKGFELEFK